MAARAIWKGVITFGDVQAPVKLYSSVEERTVHFRLLHRKDRAPVRQAMVNPDSGEVVPYEKTRRAFVTSERELVVLDEAELEALEPEASREIRVLQFLQPEAIDHRWYSRPYYLGPDRGGAKSCAALAEAMARSGREGLARWTMRRKEYAGTLRETEGRLMLITLRFAGQVVATEDLQAPGGPPLVKKELDMAKKLIDMLADDFDPTSYGDEYRARVLELIDTKSRGGRIRRKSPPKRRSTADLSAALEASLEKERKRA